MLLSVVLVGVRNLIAVIMVVLLRALRRRTHRSVGMAMLAVFVLMIMLVVVAAATFVGVLLMASMRVFMPMLLVLIVSVGSAFVNAELHALDILALLPFEMHVEVADLEFR